jgi:hypothetical protein
MEIAARLRDWLEKGCPLETAVMIERKIPYQGEDEKAIHMVCNALFNAIEYYRRMCGAADYIIQPYDDLLKNIADVYVMDWEGKNILFDFLEDSQHLWVGALIKFIEGEN